MKNTAACGANNLMSLITGLAMSSWVPAVRAFERRFLGNVEKSIRDITLNKANRWVSLISSQF